MATRGSLICFKTYNSCYKTLTTPKSTFDDVLMNTIPFFNANIWLLCQVNGEVIQESSRFKGASSCSRII